MMTINKKQMLMSIAAISAVMTILLASTTIATPALASSSSSKHEFRHDVRQFLHCVKEHDNSKISKSNFADCLTNYFNIHISKHTERHL
ncbi:MAG TPA: hypothetical protein VI278_15310 [Nitrososphaeraceae archaeon]